MPREPDWWQVCPDCGMQTSTLVPVLGDRPLEEMFDWEQRKRGLNALRAANADRLLARLKKLAPPPAELLDVGCAEGWFIQAARSHGYEA